MRLFRKDTSVRARLKEALDKAEHDMHDHAVAAAYHQVLADLNENQQIADRHRALHEMNAQLVDRYRSELDLIQARSKPQPKEIPCPAPDFTPTARSESFDAFGPPSIPLSPLHFARG